MKKIFIGPFVAMVLFCGVSCGQMDKKAAGSNANQQDTENANDYFTGLNVKVIDAQAIRDSFFEDHYPPYIVHFASVEIQNNAFDTVFLGLSRVGNNLIYNWPASENKQYINNKLCLSNLTFISKGDSILAIPKNCRDTIYLSNDPLDFSTADSIVYSGLFEFSFERIRRDSTLEISIVKRQKK